MENQGSDNKKIYIAIIVLLLLINGVGGYLLWSENKAKKDLGVQTEQLEKQYNEATATIEAKKAIIDSLITTGDIKDQEILAKRDSLEALQKSIKAMFAKGRLDKEQIAKLQEQIKAYETTIDELKQQITKLTQENKELAANNQQLTTDLTAEKQTTAELSEKNKGLSAKVELGSLLQLRNISIAGIKKKGNGKEVDQKRAKQVESLRISFETGDNKVLDPGPLSLYVRIINPKGETISVADQGSGTFTDAAGQTVQFTKKADLEWDQTNKKVVVYWSQNVKDAGKYSVEVYQSGNKIGESSVEFK